jgi:RNA polymerase-binding transcription factor DksA
MQENAVEVEHHPDPMDRASAEEAIRNEDAIAEQRRRAQANRVPPTEDGSCACGCGEDVDPRRLALGYGLTLECAERRERKAKGF